MVPLRCETRWRCAAAGHRPGRAVRAAAAARGRGQALLCPAGRCVRPPCPRGPRARARTHTWSTLPCDIESAPDRADGCARARCAARWSPQEELAAVHSRLSALKHGMLCAAAPRRAAPRRRLRASALRCDCGIHGCMLARARAAPTALVVTVRPNSAGGPTWQTVLRRSGGSLEAGGWVQGILGASGARGSATCTRAG
jgi:hypothetical protein